MLKDFLKTSSPFGNIPAEGDVQIGIWESGIEEAQRCLGDQGLLPSLIFQCNDLTRFILLDGLNHAPGCFNIPLIDTRDAVTGLQPRLVRSTANHYLVNARTPKTL